MGRLGFSMCVCVCVCVCVCLGEKGVAAKHRCKATPAAAHGQTARPLFPDTLEHTATSVARTSICESRLIC